MISSPVRSLVRQRAGDRCEYCHVPQVAIGFTFPIDHIVARQHKGGDDMSNLALSCVECNSKKGPNIAGIDPSTGLMHPLFNPREQNWTDHFRWNGAILVALTPVGRATIAVLSLNDEARIKIRQALIDEGLLPV